MFFTANPERVLATGIQRIGQYRVGAERELMQRQSFLGDFKYANAFDRGRGATEIFVNQRMIEADCFKNLRAAIRHIRRNTHFGHDFHQALANRFGVVVNRVFSRDAQIGGQMFQRLHGQVRMHRFSAIAGQQGEMMRFTH